MKNEVEVSKAFLDSYGGKKMHGFWCLELACGHKTMDRTRKDCKKYPHKKKFCGQCWSASKDS
ncbi:MAG: hypothetical protein GY755_21540 [Chloroflexi bacterium]|nr:hypothetical protein [Chloroflexota bacterium]MCP4264779.1 hypothetical protein [Candidatus Brocadiaceae bacterium]